MLSDTRIHNGNKMRQLIDFKNLEIDGYMYPTDIDGLIEYKDSEYIIFEVKYKGSAVPQGQKLALKRMIDDFTIAGKRALAIICEHSVKDASTPIVASRCKVREMYSSDSDCWVSPKNTVSTGEVVRLFHRKG